MIDTTKKHVKNGMVRHEFLFRNGFSLNINIFTGIAGETTHLSVEDNNFYPDHDSRSIGIRNYIIPISSVDELKKLSKLINIAIKERNKTLKPKKKKL